MAEGMSRMAKQKLLTNIRDRYRVSSRKGKTRILDEFIAVTGHHRKHGILLLAQPGDRSEKADVVKGRRIYDEAVREAVILVWEASDRICGKRLKAALPHLLESMEAAPSGSPFMPVRVMFQHEERGLVDVGEWIRTKRSELGLSQMRSAESIGVHAVTVKAWETGTHSPRAANQARLAVVFGEK